ncbi:Regulator of phospholipase D SRF1 [Penicillium rolfsii]|nr:Regulator of phospholipase D SRF1 [Penicillium rolfsii]
MDTMHSSKPDRASGRILNEKLSDKVPTTPCSPNTQPTHLSVDTLSAVHNGSALPAPATRTPEGLTPEEIPRSQHFTLRTLPAWIRSVEEVEDDAEGSAATDRLLPSQPRDAQVAHHNHTPYNISSHDFAQVHDPSFSEEDMPSRESRWATFARMIQYPREYIDESKEVTPDWLNENHADYAGPWRGKLLDGDSPEHPLHINARRREIWTKRFQTSLLRSPIVPLILRLTVWCFSLSALALGGSIQHLSNKGHTDQGPSALMAIIVDAVALVYLVYITFDEYTSKPLGLRSPSAKARLILLDLIFIVFDSANLSLAFNSLSEVTGSCTEAEVNQRFDPRNDRICVRQKALASVLLVALLAWLLTFCLSVLRLVERVKH